MRIKTLSRLQDAYSEGYLTEDNKLILDNDSCSVSNDDGECVFEMHPTEVLEEALKLLAIPWELP